jgi:hypothetical protein
VIPDLSDQELGQLLATQDIAFLTVAHPSFQETLELQERLTTMFPESPSSGIVAGAHDDGKAYLLNTKTLSSTRGQVSTHAVKHEGVVGIALTGASIGLDDFEELTTSCLSTMQSNGLYCCGKLGSSIFVPKSLSIGEQPPPDILWEADADATAAGAGAENEQPPTHSMSLFRLGAPVFPGSVMGCQIFEPRYRLMIKRATEAGADGTAPQPFGVCVHAGVGAVGTMMHVDKVAQISRDGKSALQLKGLRRFRVVREQVAEGTFGLSVAQVTFFDDDEGDDDEGDDDCGGEGGRGDIGGGDGAAAGTQLQRTLDAQQRRREKEGRGAMKEGESGGAKKGADEDETVIADQMLFGAASAMDKMSSLELMTQVRGETVCDHAFTYCLPPAVDTHSFSASCRSTSCSLVQQPRQPETTGKTSSSRSRPR